jgi:hypothetical protein
MNAVIDTAIAGLMIRLTPYKRPQFTDTEAKITLRDEHRGRRKDG